MSDKKTQETIKLENTARVIAWLKSPIGQEALKQTKENFPNFSRHYTTLVGFALGKYATSFSQSAIDNIEVDEVHLAVFGETDRQRIARADGAKGGKPRSDTPSRATIYRDKEKERKAKL